MTYPSSLSNGRWQLLFFSGVLVFASGLAYWNMIPSGWFRAPWDKAMHCAIFGAISYSLRPWLALRWRAIAWLLPLALGATDEITQSLSRFRSPDIWDFAADATGIVLASLLANQTARGSQLSARDGIV